MAAVLTVLRAEKMKIEGTAIVRAPEVEKTVVAVHHAPSHMTLRVGRGETQDAPAE